MGFAASTLDSPVHFELMPGERQGDPDSKVHGAYNGSTGAHRAQVGPMLAPWSLLSGESVINWWATLTPITLICTRIWPPWGKLNTFIRHQLKSRGCIHHSIFQYNGNSKNWDYFTEYFHDGLKFHFVAIDTAPWYRYIQLGHCDHIINMNRIHMNYLLKFLKGHSLTLQQT